MASLDMVIKEGVLIDRIWLKKRGFNRPAVDYFIRSGKLQAVERGVYRKPGPPLKWQNVIYSLSQLGYRIHVGHLTALKYHGFQHFVELSNGEQICVYRNKRLPKWVNTCFESARIREMLRDPFTSTFDLGIEDTPFGTWDWPISYATPERAFLELASSVSTVEEIRQAVYMMEGAVNLRPMLLQSLLEACGQVKAKRVFLWLAREQDHSWYRHIEKGKIDLGSGKRQIVKDGVMDDEFLITVPRNDENGQTESLF